MIIQSSNVIEYGEKGIGPQVIISLLFIIYSFGVKPIRNNFTNRRYYPIYISYSILITYMIYTSIDAIAVIGQLSVYTYCAYRMYRLRFVVKKSDYKNFIYKISLFFVAFCFVQLLCSTNLLPKILLKSFFFNEDSPLVQFNKSYSYFRVCGTFMESSYCATFLGGLIGFVFSFKGSLPHRKLILILLTTALVLTFSSTGYGMIVVLFMIYSLSNINNKTVKYIIPAVFIMGLFYWFAKDNIIKEVIFDKFDSASGRERKGWNEKAIIDFYSNPQTGIGLGKSRASSFILCLLAELGILGTLVYCMYLLCIYSPVIIRKHMNVFEISSRYYFLAVLIGMIIACPDQTLSSLWFGLYLISLSPYTNIE